MHITEPVRLLLADNDAMVRASLRTLIESHAGFSVVGEAEDGAAVVRLVRALEPDVVLLDPLVDGPSAAEVLRQLRGLDSQCCALLLIDGTADDRRIASAVRLAVPALVVGRSSADRLFTDVVAALEGRRQSVAGRTAGAQVSPVSEQSADGPAAVPTYGLTPRELQVVRAVVVGDSNREIASRLSISADTVKHHLSNIFDKLGVSNRLELALYASYHQLCSEPSGATSGASATSSPRPLRAVAVDCAGSAAGQVPAQGR